eukprot:4187438-Pyramimonas_sp.AAC.2
MQRRSSFSSRRHSIQQRLLEGLWRPLPESEVNGCQFQIYRTGVWPQAALSRHEAILHASAFEKQAARAEHSLGG